MGFDNLAIELLCVVLVLLALYGYLISNFAYWKLRGVKTPPTLPIFGNFKDVSLGKVLMHHKLQQIYGQFDNERLVGLFHGSKPVLMIKDPDLVKDVLIKDFPVFADRGMRVDEKVDVFGGSIFSIDPDRWRPLRAKVSPIFSSGKMKDMFYLVLECSEAFDKYVESLVDRDPIIDMRKISAKFTADVIGTCIFGLDLRSLEDEDCEFLRMSRRVLVPGKKAILAELMKMYSPWLYRKIGTYFVDHKVRDYFTKIVMDNFSYRKENNIVRHDFVDVLMDFKNHPEKVPELDLTDNFLVAQAVVFFVAGFHSSSMTVTHAIYELARQPDLQERLRKEIKEELKKTNGVLEYHSINNMKLLDGIFKETLRKYPPVIFLTRKSSRGYRFSGTNVVIPRGQDVWIPVDAIHHDPKIYPNPECFDPERFIGDSTSSSAALSHLAFGDGPRNCVGARFAVYQSKVCIIKLLMKYQAEICSKTSHEHAMKVRQFVLTPIGPVYLRLAKLN